jgi:hypothetical protein
MPRNNQNGKLVRLCNRLKAHATAANVMSLIAIAVSSHAAFFTYKSFVYQTQADQRAEEAAQRQTAAMRQKLIAEKAAHKERVMIMGLILDTNDPTEAAKLAIEHATRVLRLRPEEQELWRRATEEAHEARKLRSWEI